MIAMLPFRKPRDNVPSLPHLGNLGRTKRVVFCRGNTCGAIIWQFRVVKEHPNVCFESMLFQKCIAVAVKNADFFDARTQELRKIVLLEDEQRVELKVKGVAYGLYAIWVLSKDIIEDVLVAERKHVPARARMRPVVFLVKGLDGGTPQLVPALVSHGAQIHKDDAAIQPSKYVRKPGFFIG